jgi:hypothetical protein
MEVDDLTGHLTTDENRALLLELAPTLYSNTSYGFLFVLCPTVDKVISLVITGYSLIQLDKEICRIYNKKTTKTMTTQDYTNSTILQNETMGWDHATTKRNIP